MPSIAIDLAVPYPTIVLMGCQPNLLPRRSGACPVCKGLIGARPGAVAGQLDRRTYCAQCDALAPAHESAIRGHKLGLEKRDRSDRAEHELKQDFRKMTRNATLSERERRLIWNGYKGGISEARAEHLLGSLAVIGRKWLTEVGQAPDFALVLDRFGAVVGRREPEPEAA